MIKIKEYLIKNVQFISIDKLYFLYFPLDTLGFYEFTLDLLKMIIIKYCLYGGFNYKVGYYYCCYYF